ncbi:NAD-dependent epimerase/dehydratase family protein [Plebeiibacterium sediminum]|uniref:NAD-dependent epimerase/dehydratase family protein n=1 Tax=Plebeiibacterium sediminum TaxID=2992112 RepID=A0AAE3SFA7_9BACT|nr:NAD-dependent epimerase/dehydratase family protein [Plebeiobacterium sediminum]MCW3786872.1 NAD-dependent epimerase/dehydratase family protein [Plebeiobacterium sediminum]
MSAIDKTKPVLVTGASGYIAGVLVKRLLSEGITVHATVRNISDVKKTYYLEELSQKLPGELKLFEADLLNRGSYDKAMVGCELVYHTASPFKLNVLDPQKDLVEPALIGTANILESVNNCASVKKVVLTSSVAAIYGDNADIMDCTKGMLTEDDWNSTSTLKHQPYSYSKTVAEREAWAIYKAQNRWKLVVINPSFVIGPGLSVITSSESHNVFRKIFNGDFKIGVPDFRIGMVDVRDVAEAHYLAGYKPDSEGRYIVSAENSSMWHVSSILKEKYKNGFQFPKQVIPKAITWLVAPLVGYKRKMISRNIGYPFIADTSKSKYHLGLKYRPLKETVLEFFEQLKTA